ncbi:LamG domain-containing protein [Paenibacillus koleovorans]|uniref:LamG domain-containing protein n=1 Tax=Paenibacillus koleovorans TaxID=121608 RepID=UPI0013E32741|nr:LamG domain-containing protein [Paenibacillus koleovorans]
MKLSLFLTFRKSVVSAVALLTVGSAILTLPPQPAMAASEFTVNTGTILQSDFVGSGTQYNQNLYSTISAVDGITSGNVGLLENKVRALDSQIVRIFYDSRGEDTVNYPDYMASFEQTVALAQSSGAEINVTYWHGPYPNVTAQMQAFADELYRLKVTLGYTNVKYVTIQNEVNSTAITQTAYESFYRTLNTQLTTYGIKSGIKFIGGDLLLNGQQSWFDYMDDNMSDILDGYSVHIYWDYDNVQYGINRLDGIRTIINGLSPAGQKPVYIMEYGIRGDKVSCTHDPGCLNGTMIPIGDTIINAYQHAEFTLNAMKRKFVALTKWDAYKAKYDNGTQYHAEIGSAAAGYPLKPVYNVTRLFTHTANSHWDLLSVTGSVSGKLLTALKDPNSSNMAVYALNDTGATTTISFNGVGANKAFRLFVWNENGDGGITDKGTVSANYIGNIEVRLNKESFAAFTTLGVTDLERQAHWKFNETSGSVAADSTEYGRNGTVVSGGGWIGGRLGNALDFNGSSTYVTAPHVLNPVGPTNYGGFTASAWVRPDTDTGASQYILQQAGTNGKVWLVRYLDGRLETFLGGVGTFSTGTIPLNAWTHVAVTYDGSMLRLYLNGVLDGTRTIALDSEGTGGMIIGANKTFGNLFNGGIDEVSIYNRQLTTNEIRDQFNSTWWKFDETSGTVASDSASYSQAATLVNGATFATGRVGNALYLDGVNDYATAPNVANPGTTSFTATAWVKHDGAASTAKYVLQQDGTNGRIWLYRDSTGVVGTYIGGVPLLGTTNIPVNQWVFIAVTYDGTTAKVYMNGTQENSAARAVASETSGVIIGASKTFGNLWKGWIDDTRIYTRALSATEIKDQYELGR